MYLTITIIEKHYKQGTYCNTLPHDARLLHTARTTKLLHVFAKVALPTLRAQACFTLSTACPSPPGTRCSPTCWQLDCWCRRCCHLRFWPVGRPRLKGWRGYRVRSLKMINQQIFGKWTSKSQMNWCGGMLLLKYSQVVEYSCHKTVRQICSISKAASLHHWLLDLGLNKRQTI